MIWTKNLEYMKEKMPEQLGRDSEALVRANMDAEGKYAQKFLSRLKDNYKLNSDLMKTIGSNVVGFEDELEELSYKAKALNTLCENNIDKLAELVIQCKEEFDLSNKLQKRLDLVEGQKGTEDISIDQLDELELLFTKNLDLIKNEKWRRQFQDNIGKFGVGIDEKVLKQLQSCLQKTKNEKVDPANKTNVRTSNGNNDDEEQQMKYSLFI